ncbi:uracil-DNA glycosylase [Roseibium sp. RKSG952]|nr:uracil-DNA glycosylase [Roseibium sp. RKSG952]MTH96296.1 uracil-DNA glycosylase [Roseibium sp. RKSG952]
METNRELESLLDFYSAAGVDGFLDEDPVDWYDLSRKQAEQRANAQQAQMRAAPQTRPAAPSPPMPQATPQMPQPGPFGVPPQPQPPQPQNAPAGPGAAPGGERPVILPDAAAVQAARDAARTAGSLDELRKCLERFEGCNLKLTAKNLVFSDGNPDGRVMLIGNAPDRDDDLQGRPFTNRSGQLLDRMLKAVNLDRSSVYIANVVPWRPPGNRKPTPQETEICKPFILRQIELAKPDVIVFLGEDAVRPLLGGRDGIRKLRGSWNTFPAGGRDVPCLATYHPAYLLRSPLEKRLSWRDFLSLRQKLDANSTA